MNEKQHTVLIELIKELFSQFEKIPTSMEHYDVFYSEQGEYITWINYQINVLSDSFDLIKNNSYKSVFSLIRSAYESYWVLLLAMMGTKYYIKYIPKDESNIQKIHQQFIKDFEENKYERNEQGILKINSIKNNSFKIEYIGRKNKDGQIIPHYYFLFNDFNPEIAYLGFDEDYYDSEKLNKIKEEMIKKHKGLNYYFRFDKGIKENLILNNLISEKNFEKMLVHYSFLSMWTHPSKNSIDMVEKNIHKLENYKEINNKYDFYLTRLGLLYIGNLLSMYIELWISFGKRQIDEKKLKSLNYVEDFNKVISNFKEKNDYFWFIFNKPSNYYKWDYLYKRLTKKEMSVEEIKKIDYTLINEDLIMYYINPLETLKELVRSVKHPIIGDYESPILNDLIVGDKQ